MVTKKRTPKRDAGEQISTRVDAERQKMLAALMKKYGSSRSGIVNRAISEMAERDLGWGKK